MNSLAEWLHAHAAGHSYLQVGGLGNPGLEYAEAALSAGALRATHMEQVTHSPGEWAALRLACAAHRERFATLTQEPSDGYELQRKLPFFDIVHITQLFHERDPYLLLDRLSRHAKRHLVVTSVIIPEGLAPGDSVPGYRLGDARLATVERVLAERGVALGQFVRPPDKLDVAGIATWEGMWNWFHSEAALRGLVAHFGWRITHAWPSWVGLGLTLLAEREASFS